MEVVEVVRRWQAGSGPRKIAHSLGLSRNTVRRYLAAADRLGLARDGPPPTEAQLATLLQDHRPGPRPAAGPSVALARRHAKVSTGRIESPHPDESLGVKQDGGKGV